MSEDTEDSKSVIRMEKGLRDNVYYAGNALRLVEQLEYGNSCNGGIVVGI